jgi:3D (Asp-Asp-Asp) domain-containing protein
MRRGRQLFCGALLAVILSGCDNSDNYAGGSGGGNSSPSANDLAQGDQLANAAAGTNSIVGGSPPPIGNGDLSVLGVDANTNQQGFRDRFGLGTPSADQMAQWSEYNTRFTEYNPNEPDWPAPTVARQNWEGTTWTNGDPLAIAGTTIAVDPTKIPIGSLVYIPSMNMYAEAIDTGATKLWAQQDARMSDEGPNGSSRTDIYINPSNQSNRQVENSFNHWVGNNEYGQIYVVSSGTGWKKGH